MLAAVGTTWNRWPTGVKQGNLGLISILRAALKQMKRGRYSLWPGLGVEQNQNQNFVQEPKFLFFPYHKVSLNPQPGQVRFNQFNQHSTSAKDHNLSGYVGRYLMRGEVGSVPTSLLKINQIGLVLNWIGDVCLLLHSVVKAHRQTTVSDWQAMLIHRCLYSPPLIIIHLIVHLIIACLYFSVWSRSQLAMY